MRILPAFIVLMTLGLADEARADRFEPQSDRWILYVDDRGTLLALPSDVFSPGVSEKTASGRTFISEDGKLEVRAWPNGNGWSAKTLKQELLRKPEYQEVTYSPSGTDWLVLSGFRDDDTIYYEKYIFRGGMLHAFAIEFPVEAEPFYAPIIEHMENTFRVAPKADRLSGAKPPPSATQHAPPEGGSDPLVIY